MNKFLMRLFGITYKLERDRKILIQTLENNRPLSRPGPLPDAKGMAIDIGYGECLVIIKAYYKSEYGL